LTMISDEALMLEFQRGSREAFEELFARYREPLFGFFRRRLENRERAEDLAQETFLAVIRAAARYEPRALVRTYLYGIALKLLGAERRKLSGKEQPVEAGNEPEIEDASETSLWVRQALEKLDAAEREILMLREYEQLNYAEIAELLRLPVNTVRSRLFRSRMALKGHLEPKRRFHGAAAASSSGAPDKTARPTEDEA
jgi:RNA polymerase sigma factor (sigma-70 family)